MKTALCIKDLNTFKEEIERKTSTLDLYLVDREICEDPKNGYLQIIPYVVFFHRNYVEGSLRILAYNRPEKNNEERLSSKLSFGFGGHIDSSDRIAALHESEEDGQKHFISNNDLLIATIVTSAGREIKEELGEHAFSIFEEKCMKNTNVDINFFLGNQDIEVNKVHLAAAILIELEDEVLQELIDKAEYNDEEISDLGDIRVDFRSIIEEFDLSNSINRVNEELVNMNIEDWSSYCFKLLIVNAVSLMLRDINYSDLLTLMASKLEEANREMLEASEDAEVTDVIEAEVKTDE